MRPIQVECVHRSDDRASGIVKMEGVLPVTWTAINSESSWYVILNTKWTGAQTELRFVLTAIENAIEPKVQAA
ncbi:MAG: hypothetical protein JKX97_08100 [Candidatus Lindowbacteria bacterium]|nr:hypothetical protein [Candidatus Lindowbacteria bacterium]